MMQVRKVLTMSVVGALAAGLVFAQDKPILQLAQKDKAEAKKPSARLPNYFRSLGLSEKQRESILDTIVDYNAQIDELEDQISALREKRDAEVHSILTPEQKEKLAELQMDAKKRRAEKADKSKKAAEPAGEDK